MLTKYELKILTSVYGVGAAEAAALVNTLNAIEARVAVSVPQLALDALDQLAANGAVTTAQRTAVEAAMQNAIAQTPDATPNSNVVRVFTQQLVINTAWRAAPTVGGLYYVEPAPTVCSLELAATPAEIEAALSLGAPPAAFSVISGQSYGTAVISALGASQILGAAASTGIGTVDVVPLPTGTGKRTVELVFTAPEITGAQDVTSKVEFLDAATVTTVLGYVQLVSTGGATSLQAFVDGDLSATEIVANAGTSVRVGVLFDAAGGSIGFYVDNVELHSGAVALEDSVAYLTVTESAAVDAGFADAAVSIALVSDTASITGYYGAGATDMCGAAITTPPPFSCVYAFDLAAFSSIGGTSFPTVDVETQSASYVTTGAVDAEYGLIPTIVLDPAPDFTVGKVTLGSAPVYFELGITAAAWPGNAGTAGTREIGVSLFNLPEFSQEKLYLSNGGLGHEIKFNSTSIEKFGFPDEFTTALVDARIGVVVDPVTGKVGIVPGPWLLDEQLPLYSAQTVFADATEFVIGLYGLDKQYPSGPATTPGDTYGIRLYSNPTDFALVPVAGAYDVCGNAIAAAQYTPSTYVLDATAGELTGAGFGWVGKLDPFEDRLFWYNVQGGLTAPGEEHAAGPASLTAGAKLDFSDAAGVAIEIVMPNFPGLSGGGALSANAILAPSALTPYLIINQYANSDGTFGLDVRKMTGGGPVTMYSEALNVAAYSVIGVRLQAGSLRVWADGVEKTLTIDTYAETSLGLLFTVDESNGVLPADAGDVVIIGFRDTAPHFTTPFPAGTKDPHGNVVGA